MTRLIHMLVVTALLGVAGMAQAQKRGGILTIHSPDSPGGMSILEEATQYAVGPMMGVMSNLLIFDQSAKQNSLQTIVPDLATSWRCSNDRMALTLPLRQGVRWHDGKPFTAQDVLCTWALLMETGTDRLRINPRKGWYENLERVSANGEFEVTFHLKRPQPAFSMFIAAGVSPIYPCHVPAREMRTHPIGTGPFKFVEYKPSQHVRVTRNTDYWNPNRPYLDGIEYVIISDPATANLAFIAGKLDMTFPQNVTIPQLKTIRADRPSAICEITPGAGLNRDLIVNRGRPPFDNADLRRAMALAIDRQAFIDIIAEGQGEIGGVLQPAPDGLWGMPVEQLRTLPGYDPDVAKNREQGRQIMRGLGYGPENRLKVKLLTRNIPLYRAPAVILLDQLREVFIDAELDAVETAT